MASETVARWTNPKNWTPWGAVRAAEEEVHQWTGAAAPQTGAEVPRSGAAAPQTGAAVPKSGAAAPQTAAGPAPPEARHRGFQSAERWTNPANWTPWGAVSAAQEEVRQWTGAAPQGSEAAPPSCAGAPAAPLPVPGRPPHRDAGVSGNAPHRVVAGAAPESAASEQHPRNTEHHQGVPPASKKLKAAAPAAPVVHAAPTAGAAPLSLKQELEELKEMLDTGILTAQEFQAEKAKVLERTR